MKVSELIEAAKSSDDKLKLKVPTLKKRDPSYSVLQAKGTSGAMGKHRDKKREAELGKFKHKGKIEEDEELDEDGFVKVPKRNLKKVASVTAKAEKKNTRTGGWKIGDWK